MDRKSRSGKSKKVVKSKGKAWGASPSIPVLRGAGDMVSERMVNSPWRR